MNAIAGVVGAAPDAERVVTALLAGMRGRGPDGEGARAVSAGALGACWSGSSAAAPGQDATGRWWVVLDAVPLNLRSLREELVARELIGVDATATEVVATLCAEQGFERGWARVDGEVAGAAWDDHDGVLWLARDRLGACGLAWRLLSDGALAFATDPAVLARLGDPPPVDVVAIGAGVDLGGVPSPASAWSGISRLPPGHLLRHPAASAGPPSVRAWWTLGVHPAGAGGAFHRWATSVRFATDLAVRLRLPDRGPVAVALSGGVFSAAVAQRARDRVLTFGLTLHFDDGSAAHTGGSAAIHVSPRLGDLPIHAVHLGAADLPGLLDELTRGMATPVFSVDLLAWWVLAREAWARDATALLTGVGGAATHLIPVRRRVDRLRARLEALRHAPGTSDAEVTRRACGVTLPERDLAALDLAGAAWQVPVLAPLADANLVALVTQVPLEHLRAGGRDRALFLAAMAEGAASPGSTPHRPLAVPVGAWLRGGARPLLDGLPGALADLLDPAHVAWLIDDHLGGRADHGPRLWALLVLARWWGAARSPGPGR